MKNLSLSLILACFTLQFGFSQTNADNIKRQYIDKVNTETTVVVKQDAASDMDVLNRQFNLNDVSMGEVIFIKTEDLASTKPKAERTSFSQMVQESSKPARTVATQPVEAETAQPIAAITTTPARKSSRAASARPQMRAKTKASTTNKSRTIAKKSVAPPAQRSSRYSGTGSLRKVKTKRIKLKKRKRVRRGKRNKCFSF